MTERWKDVFIVITLGIVAVLAMSWLVDILLIDRLKVNEGFLGSILGGLVGALGVIFTTYFIIKAQKAENLQQIEAQKEITLKQVSDADFKSRMLLLNQIKLNKYERILTTLNNLEYQIKIFQKNAKDLIVLKTSFDAQKLEKEQIEWIRAASDEKANSYYIVNNSILTLITNLRIDKLEDILKLTVLGVNLSKLADEAENLLVISDKKGSTVEEVENKIKDLMSIFTILSSDLRKYILENIELIEQELVKKLNV